MIKDNGNVIDKQRQPTTQDTKKMVEDINSHLKIRSWEPQMRQNMQYQPFFTSLKMIFSSSIHMRAQLVI